MQYIILKIQFENTNHSGLSEMTGKHVVRNKRGPYDSVKVMSG